jgi:hypothetical protein
MVLISHVKKISYFGSNTQRLRCLLGMPPSSYRKTAMLARSDTELQYLTDKSTSSWQTIQPFRPQAVRRRPALVHATSKRGRRRATGWFAGTAELLRRNLKNWRQTTCTTDERKPCYHLNKGGLQKITLVNFTETARRQHYCTIKIQVLVHLVESAVWVDNTIIPLKLEH